MLPTSFEKIPDIIREIQNLIHHKVWAEVDEFGTVDFVHYIGQKRVFGYDILFSVRGSEDVMVEYIHYRRGLNK